MEAAERIRAAVARMRVMAAGGETAGTTISAGVADFENGQGDTGGAACSTRPTRRSTTRRRRVATGSACSRPSTAGPPCRSRGGSRAHSVVPTPRGDLPSGRGQREQAEHRVQADERGVPYEEVRGLTVRNQAEHRPATRSPPAPTR